MRRIDFKALLVMISVVVLSGVANASQGVLVTNGSLLQKGRGELTSMVVNVDENDLAALGFRFGIFDNIEIEADSKTTNGVTVGSMGARGTFKVGGQFEFLAEIEGRFSNGGTIALTTDGFAFDKDLRFALVGQGKYRDDITFSLGVVSQKNGDGQRTFSGEAYINYVYSKILDATLEFRQENSYYYSNSIAGYVGVTLKGLKIQVGLLKLPEQELRVQPILRVAKNF